MPVLSRLRWPRSGEEVGKLIDGGRGSLATVLRGWPRRAARRISASQVGRSGGGRSWAEGPGTGTRSGRRLGMPRGSGGSCKKRRDSSGVSSERRQGAALSRHIGLLLEPRPSAPFTRRTPVSCASMPASPKSAATALPAPSLLGLGPSCQILAHENTCSCGNRVQMVTGKSFRFVAQKCAARIRALGGQPEAARAALSREGRSVAPACRPRIQVSSWNPKRPFPAPACRTALIGSASPTWRMRPPPPPSPPSLAGAPATPRTVSPVRSGPRAQAPR